MSWIFLSFTRLERRKSHIGTFMICWNSCLALKASNALTQVEMSTLDFRNVFFCDKYRCRQSGAKNLNASKNTSMNLIFLLMLSLFSPGEHNFASTHFSSLQLVFCCVFLAFLRLSWTREQEISYLCQVLFECRTMHGSSISSHECREDFLMAFPVFAFLLFHFVSPFLGYHQIWFHQVLSKNLS